jgi:hypothetical protein
MPEFKVYVTEDAEAGLDEALTAIEAQIDGLLEDAVTKTTEIVALTQAAISSVSDTQSTTWNAQTALVDKHGKAQKLRLDTAYDDPEEDLEALGSNAYTAAKPIFRSSPKTNQAQSFRKHVAQNRFFAHDGIFLDPSARVFPWHNSVANQKRFTLQTAAEKAAWLDFFEVNKT